MVNDKGETVVYVLSTGEYSEYTVFGVCSTLEEALRVTGEISVHDWNYPEEFVLDEFTEKMKDPMRKYCIHTNGEKLRVSVDFVYYPGDKNYIHITDKETNWVGANILSDGMEKALVIFHEKLAYMKANDLGFLSW